MLNQSPSPEVRWPTSAVDAGLGGLTQGNLTFKNKSKPAVTSCSALCPACPAKARLSNCAPSSYAGQLSSLLSATVLFPRTPAPVKQDAGKQRPPQAPPQCRHTEAQWVGSIKLHSKSKLNGEALQCQFILIGLCVIYGLPLFFIIVKHLKIT